MKSTYVWSALVATLAAYVVYDYRHSAPEKMGVGETKAFSIPRADVSAVSLTRDGQTISIVKDGDEWRVEKPLADFAEETSVDGFLFGLENEKLREFRDADDRSAPDWTKYGLDKPSVVVELKSARATEAIALSSKNAFDGSFYVRRGDQLLLGAAGLAQTTNRNLSSLRSRRIWRHADARVTRIAATYPDRAKSFVVAKGADGWGIDPKPAFPTDKERIEKWVNAVEDLTVGEFVSESPTPADLKARGLDRPQATIDIGYQAEGQPPGTWTLTLGPERGTDVYFYTNDRPALVKTTAAAVRKLLATSAYFRDGRQPFRFAVDRATEVRVSTKGVDRVIKKGDAGWTLTNAAEGESLNEAEFTELMAGVGTLDAADFPGPAVKVSTKPALELRDRDQKTLFSLAIGDEYAPRTPWTIGAKLKAVRVGDETFGLPAAQIDNLIKGRLVQKAPVKTTER